MTTRLAASMTAIGAPDVAAVAPASRLRFTEHARAQRAARLCELAAFLPPDEQALVLATYADGRTGPQVAALIGCTRQTVQRRLSRLRRRLLAPEFAALAPRVSALDASLRSVAQLCIIEGRSVRDAAARLRMTQHAVREARLALLVMAGASNGRAATRS